jgi:hypothetical protein
LQWSDDNVSWTTLQSYAQPGGWTWGMNEKRTFKTNTFRFWRINITAVQSGAVMFDDPHMDQIELAASAGGADLTTPAMADKCTASSVQGDPASIGSLVDNTLEAGGGWSAAYSDSAVGVPAWWQIDMVNQTTVKELRIVPDTVTNWNGTPKDFQIQGSDNGSNWVTVKSFAGVTDWTHLTAKTFSLV